MAADCDTAIGSLASIQGEMEIQSGATGISQPAVLEGPLCPGDLIRVGNYARAELSIINQPNVRLDQNTILQLPGEELPDEGKPWLIRLFSGTAYFFSRHPRTLSVDTPFVNAAVEGTEFLVRVEQNRTLIVVFEGRIIASNARGELRLARGESAVAEAGQAPTPFLLVRPTDAVQWAIYYPHILPATADPSGVAAQELPEPIRGAVQLAARGDVRAALARFEAIPEAQRGAEFFLYRAAAVLSVGRTEEARANINKALTRDPDNGLAHALNAVIALAQNETDVAIAEAQRAVDLRPREAAARIALSYAEQGQFRLGAARDALDQAVKDEPRNALAWARLAELWLMLGYRKRAREAAETAAALAPDLERIQTVLGFAALAEFRAATAKRAFERAIALNSASPLPRFGLGLAKIRKGNLEEGRRDIEVAVALDPNNSLLRSYLGKAYFEERITNSLAYFRQWFEDFPNQENTLAAEQFAIAKDLDPWDPTPYLYDAIRKQSENRPVEALRDAETAIRLNENRAVYRSRELLDQDRAARQASLGRIYNDLGFQQLGVNEAAKALALDPASPSAHRFLSDVYAYTPFQRREIARVSELLQAQLLQDININPIQPSRGETNLNVFARGGPTRPGFNEFTPLFERDQVQLNLSGEVGSNDTFANEAVVSGLYDRFSVSAGQFHYQTDGFRPNNDIEHNFYNIFAQAALTPDVGVQAEFLRRDTEEGDLRILFDPDRFAPLRRRELKQNTERFGSRISLSPRSNLIASLVHSKYEESTGIFSFEDESLQAEAQHIFRNYNFNILTGFNAYYINGLIILPERVLIPGRILAEQKRTRDVVHTSGYVYSNIEFPADVFWSFGVSFDDYEEEDLAIRKFSPKLGMQWVITEWLRLRFAAFETVKPASPARRTIQPTQVAGFNQLFDDADGTESWSYGAGIDARLTKDLSLGMEILRRTLDESVLNFDKNTRIREDREETLFRAYAYWSLSPSWAFSTELQFEGYDGNPGLRNVQFPGKADKVDTWAVPVSVRYFHPTGFFGALAATFVHQDVDTQLVPDEASEFVVVDFALGYRFPHRRGSISFEVTNLFNEQFEFAWGFYRPANREVPTVSPFIPERTLLARLTLSF